MFLQLYEITNIPSKNHFLGGFLFEILISFNSKNREFSDYCIDYYITI